MPPSDVESFFPIIAVADLDRSLAFYEGMLGLTRTYRWPPDGELEFAVVGTGESALGIGRAKRAYDADDRLQLCVYVGSVDETVEALRAGGVSVLQEPENMPWGERMAWVADPDGFRLLLAQRSSETVTSS